MTEQAKSQTTKAILLPIAGLLVAGIVGTIAVPEISRATADPDKLFAFTTAFFLIASIFGASVIWAQVVVAKLSLVSQIDSIRSANTMVISMQWVWLSVNSMAFLSFLTAFSTQVSFGARSYGESDTITAVNPWTAVPLSMLGVLVLVQALVFLEYTSRTVVPARVAYKPAV